MLLRIALIPLAVVLLWQTAYGESGTVHRRDATADTTTVHSSSYHGGWMSAGPQMDGIIMMPTEGVSTDSGYCESAGTPGGPNYVPRWHRMLVSPYWTYYGLPSPWHPPGNLMLRIPYTQYGSTYYYFRPYHWFHVPAQQEEAMNYGSDPRNPYDNRVVFDGLYEGL